jgi:hypothetical protein
MARVQLIICDKCKRKSTELFSLEFNYNSSIFEICEECSKELIEICLEPPEVFFEKKNKPTYRKGEVEADTSKGTVVRRPCKHENQEYEDPGKLICTDCGHISKA